MLELQHISYETEENREILHDINLTIADRFVAITGPNGGGKSTLAKIIAGIYTPTAGRLLLDGEDITGLSVTERARRGISYAFQQPVRFKGLRVGDLMNLAAGKNANIAEVCAYLSEVGLCARDYIDRELDASLSGGELKRIEIAMILARGTALSVFDEPEAGIDLWSFQNLIRVFEKMYEKTRGSILIISHQERILNIADTIVLLKDGRLVECGPRAEVLPRLLRNIDTAPPVCSMLSDTVKEALRRAAIPLPISISSPRPTAPASISSSPPVPKMKASTSRWSSAKRGSRILSTMIFTSGKMPMSSSSPGAASTAPGRKRPPTTASIPSMWAKTPACAMWKSTTARARGAASG